jgi:ferredoxin
MADENAPIHYVSTMEQARALIARHDRYWVWDCGCREGRGKCERSRHDVCLTFMVGEDGDGPPATELSRGEVEGILLEAVEKRLVARPFRESPARGAETMGVCFCCNDCCGYFLNPAEDACDRGSQIEATDWDECTHCGVCADVCYFGARKMGERDLTVDQSLCYGCGLCADTCPECSVEMVGRA